MKRIYLSPPDIGPLDRQLLLDAVDSGWVAPLGPHVDEFEREIAAAAAVPYAVALSSGTAALHLALAALGIGPGDEVLTSTLTFAATANAIAYVGAVPVFIDASAETWTIDPDLLDEELTERAKAGRRPAAVLAVDLYGQCCDYHPIADLCERHGVPLIEDAAEALGSSYHGRPAGAFGSWAIFSFNGNKIITTSGGGMLVSHSRRNRRTGPPPRHAGPRPGTALRALRDRLQLPAEQPPRRARARPARKASRPRWNAAARSGVNTLTRLRATRELASCLKPAMAVRTPG